MFERLCTYRLPVDVRDLQAILVNECLEEHVREGGVVVSAGLDIFRAGRDGDFNSIFERADQRMYEKKKYLKSLKTEAAPATPA